MTHTEPHPALRRLLWLDGLSCAAFGALLPALRQPLSTLTGLPAPLILWAGLLLWPVAAILMVAATRPRIPPLPVRFVIAVNLIWSAASLIVLLILPLTTMGLVLVLAQMLVVLATAGLQHRLLGAAADRAAAPPAVTGPRA